MLDGPGHLPWLARGMLDQETINIVLDGMLDEFVPGLAAKCLKIRDRTGVGRQDFEGPAGRYVFQGFSGLEDGQGTIHSFCVKCLVSHFLLLQSSYLLADVR